jgi:hypothetical protein
MCLSFARFYNVFVEFVVPTEVCRCFKEFCTFCNLCLKFDLITSCQFFCPCSITSENTCVPFLCLSSFVLLYVLFLLTMTFISYIHAQTTEL